MPHRLLPRSVLLPLRDRPSENGNPPPTCFCRLHLPALRNMSRKTAPSPRMNVFTLVLAQCSLYDVYRLTFLSRSARRIINASPHIWREALERLDQVPPPPTISASGFWGHAAYVRLIFGPSPCTVCTQRCTTLPSSFALGVRFCSKTCEEKVTRHHAMPVLPHWTATVASAAYSLDDIGFRKWIPHPHQRTLKFHLPSAVLAAAAERRQANYVDAGVLIGKGRFVRRTSEELQQEWIERFRSWITIKAVCSPFSVYPSKENL
ncbi:hypothetical protein B0H16DRAFT_818397 [Mycena metata]|uniref:Uncharacterized protein n=1 Tax=Mycena metata TaxID=1033252 RepID=A0AAD7GNX8_9AGAR|nr:hypothetical protein B0H16DRAFT_818397 [Mycena metata]